MTEQSDKSDAEAMAARELRIREKAYKLWEMDGSPQGQAEHYWKLASELIDAENSEATSRSL